MKRKNPWNIILEEITFRLKTDPYNRNVISSPRTFFQGFCQCFDKIFTRGSSDVILWKGNLKMCREFAGKYPCQSVILIILIWWVLSRKYAAYFLLWKGNLKMCREFAGKYPCQSVILIILIWWVLSRKYAAYFQDNFT